MNLTYLFEYVNPITMGICLCVGYAVKSAKVFEKIGNNYIPLILLILGCLINVAINYRHIDATVILGGMMSGLVSVGLHQVFKQLLTREESEA